MKHPHPPTKVCSMLLAFVAALALVAGPAAAAEKGTAAKKPAPRLSVVAGGDAAPGFSFVAVGDSRPMMYLPPKGSKPDLVKLFVEMFGLVMPEKIAEEVVQKDVKMIFDPATKELITIIMPFMTQTEVMTLTVDKGWITEASVEDVKLL